jgi:hypothetical protein
LNEFILTPGRILTGQQYRYHLDKLLSIGKYGQVWLTTRLGKTSLGQPVSVALKTMRPGLSEADQRRFWFEVEILAQLRAAEEKAKFWTDDESRLPVVLDTGAADETQPAFFVQPLAQGAPLDELLRAQGRLPETEALEILGQVSRVFQLLHQATGRSHLDFQPKNIFWDAASQRVLVIDWNLLSEVGAGQEADDLAALAGLSYRSVMGLPAPLAGSVRALAQPAERWAAVSRPMQRLLAKTLHPNKSTRYETMADLVVAIDEVKQVWRQCSHPDFGESLSHYVRQAAEAKATISDPAQSAEARQTARQRVERAADWLSVARQYEGFDETQRYEIERAGQPLAAWLTGQGAFGIGQQFFNVPSYADAARQFEQAATEAWSDETALTAQRWQVATAAAQQGRYEAPQRELLMAALDGLAAGDLTTAEQALTKLPVAEKLALLRVEIALRRGLPQAAQQAEAGDSQAATMMVERLEAQMDTLPPEDQAALTGVSGDLTALAAQYRAGAAAAKETAALTALFERNFETGFAELQRKLDVKPGDPELIAAAQSLTAQYRVQAPKQAGRLAALALDYTPANETRQKLLDDWNQSRENLDKKLDHYVRAAQVAEQDKAEQEKARQEEVRLAQIAAVTAAREAERTRAEKNAAEARVAQAETAKREAEEFVEKAKLAQQAAEEKARLAEQALQAQWTKEQGQPWREQVQQAEESAKAAVQAQRAAEERAKQAEQRYKEAEQTRHEALKRAKQAEDALTAAQRADQSQSVTPVVVGGSSSGVKGMVPHGKVTAGDNPVVVGGVPPQIMKEQKARLAAEERARLAEQALQAQRAKEQAQPWREQVRQAEEAVKAAVQAQRAAEERAAQAEAEKNAAEARVAQAEIAKREAENLATEALRAQYDAEEKARQAKAEQAAAQAELTRLKAEAQAEQQYRRRDIQPPQVTVPMPPLPKVYAPFDETTVVNKAEGPRWHTLDTPWYNRSASNRQILFASLIGVMGLLMVVVGGLMVFNFISQRQAAAAAVAQQQAKLATKNAKQTDTAATATVAAKQTGTAVAQETPLTATGTPTATSTATPIVTDTPVVIATLGSPPDADSDGDGVTDVEETTRGTDPNLNTAPLTFPVEGSELPVLPWRITFPAVETDPESLPVKLSVTQIVDGKAAAPSESQVAFIKTGAFYEYQREVGEGDPRPTGPYSATQREWTAAITLTGQTVEGVVNANIGRFGRPFFTDPAETQALLETTLKNASVIVLGRFEFHDANGQIPKANFGFGDVTQNWCYLQKKDDGGYGWTYCQYTGAKGFEALPLLAPAEVVEVEAAPVPPLPTVTPSPTETPIPTSTLEAQAIISPVVTPIDITATPGIFTTIIDPAQVMTEKNGSTPVPNVPPGQVTVVSNESGEVTSQWLQVTWSTDEASSIIGWVRVKDTDWLKLNPELSDEQLQLRPEPSDGATSNLLPLNKGDRIILNEEKVADDTKIWLKVSNPEGQEGWIKADFTNYAIQPQ